MTEYGYIAIPKISASLNPHQGTSSCINTETHNWPLHKLRDFRVLSPKWNVFNKPLLSRLKDLCRSGGRKILRTRGSGCCQ